MCISHGVLFEIKVRAQRRIWRYFKSYAVLLSEWCEFNGSSTQYLSLRTSIERSEQPHDYEDSRYPCHGSGAI